MILSGITQILEGIKNHLYNQMLKLLELIKKPDSNSENAQGKTKKSGLHKLSFFPEIVETFTYHEVVEYFVKNRPNKMAVKGVIIKEQHPKGQMIIQVFLDQKDELVCQSNGISYGRKQIVKNFDEELKEYFGDKSMIIFQ